MRLIRYLIVGALVALLVLACSDSSTQPGKLQFSFSQSACHRDLSAGGTTLPDKDDIWYETHCDTLRVHHDGRLSNCCSKFTYEITQQANLLTLTETDTTSVFCRCADCQFDLSAQISGLSGGSYTVRIRDGKSDSLLDSTVVGIAPCLPQ